MPGQGRHASKTRTACLTCKKRRVKCGLERPSCVRCLKADRICEGYQLSVIEAQPSPSSRQTTPPHLNHSSSLLSAFRATESEWHAYGHYNHRVASLLTGAFNVDLWQKLMVQVADSEPTIRHGIFALGYLFKHTDVSTDMSECVCDNCRQALRHFNKSIASFSDSRQQPLIEQPTEVALLSCLIYICLETYRLNDRNAISLIAKGCKIIEEARPKGPGTRMPSIDSRLVQLFDRLWLLSSMFGRHVPRPLPRSPQLLGSGQLPKVQSIETARDALHEIITFTQSLRLRVGQAQLGSMTGMERSAVMSVLQEEQSAIRLLLQDWNRDLQVIQQQQHLTQCKHSQAWFILMVQYLVTKISAESSMYPSEREGEDQLEDFSHLVNVAEEGLAMAPQVTDSPSFTFESCYLPSLYLTVRKCRDPTIRRKALKLMCLSGRKEGLWYRPELIQIAARIIELEEGLAVFGPGDQPSEDLDSKPLRFYDVLVDMNYRRAGKTYVNITYLIYVKDSIQRWRSVQEILTIVD